MCAFITFIQQEKYQKCCSSMTMPGHIQVALNWDHNKIWVDSVAAHTMQSLHYTIRFQCVWSFEKKPATLHTWMIRHCRMPCASGSREGVQFSPGSCSVVDEDCYQDGDCADKELCLQNAEMKFLEIFTSSFWIAWNEKNRHYFLSDLHIIKLSLCSVHEKNTYYRFHVYLSPG